MTLNLSLLYWFWFVEYCQTSPNKKNHQTCCIFGCTYIPNWIKRFYLSYQYFTGVEIDGQTIHPTQKFISMNLFEILSVITWAWLFLASMVVEAVRGQKLYCEQTATVHSATSRILEQNRRSWFLVIIYFWLDFKIF